MRVGIAPRSATDPLGIVEQVEVGENPEVVVEATVCCCRGSQYDQEIAEGFRNKDRVLRRGARRGELSC